MPYVPPKSSYIEGATKGITVLTEDRIKQSISAIFGQCMILDYSKLVQSDTKKPFAIIAQDNSCWLVIGNSVCLEIYNRSPNMKINRMVRGLFEHHVPKMHLREHLFPPFQGGDTPSLGSGMVIGGRLLPSKDDNFTKANFAEALSIVCALGLELKYEVMD